MAMEWSRAQGGDPEPPPPPGPCPAGGEHDWVFSGHIRRCTKCGAQDVVH